MPHRAIRRAAPLLRRRPAPPVTTFRIGHRQLALRTTRHGENHREAKKHLHARRSSIPSVEKKTPCFEARAIGHVESPLTDLDSAPLQGDEGSPEASLVFHPDVLAALEGLHPGDEVLVLTWLDRAHRNVLSVHPRGDRSRPPQGVFNTRSPHRPNPIGLHRVKILAIEGARVTVQNLEALNETPILDIKPILSRDS